MDRIADLEYELNEIKGLEKHQIIAESTYKDAVSKLEHENTKLYEKKRELSLQLQYFEDQFENFVTHL